VFIPGGEAEHARGRLLKGHEIEGREGEGPGESKL